MKMFLDKITAFHSTVSVNNGEKVTKPDGVGFIFILGKIHTTIESNSDSVFIHFPYNSSMSTDYKGLDET